MINRHRRPGKLHYPRHLAGQGCFGPPPSSLSSSLASSLRSTASLSTSSRSSTSLASSSRSSFSLASSLSSLLFRPSVQASPSGLASPSVHVCHLSLSHSYWPYYFRLHYLRLLCPLRLHWHHLRLLQIHGLQHLRLLRPLRLHCQLTRVLQLHRLRHRPIASTTP